jgi:hypothetical protein|tara:strand:- start:569 stop:775 length:207 start_codon:yes stop_codon:yes gene_type:complete
MPDFICENCGRREFHENADTLKMMVKIHEEFCRKKEGQDHSFMHRDDVSDGPMDVERATDEKDVPILK